MALERKAYENWDISAQAAKVLSIANQLKNAYKGTIQDPANAIVDVEKEFAPSHLFFTDKDLYYSDFERINPDYVYEFLDYDPRAPHRGFFKRTDVGLMFPEVVKPSDVPGPGKELVWKRREPVNVVQDESAPLPDIHFRNCVDFAMFDFSRHFLDSTDYSRIKNAIFDAMRAGNAQIEKLWVDTFLASILGVWSYPYGDPLFQFFTENDDYVPDENFSKVSHNFLKKDGEFRKHLDELRKYVTKYYVNRFPYLTSVNTHEVIGQSLNLTVPEYSKMLADKSDASKTLKWIQKCFLAENKNKKFTEVAYTLRRLSVDSLAKVTFKVIDRMTRPNNMNWCGHVYGKDVKDEKGRMLRSKPWNLLVFMNNEDLNDMHMVLGSQIKGPFTEQTGLLDKLSEYKSKGVKFYGVDFILPSMAIVLDKIAFRLIEYFNESYSKFHEYDLVESTVHHLFKKPILYRYVNCSVIELADEQKFALPLAWASEHLPYLRETT